MRVHTKPETGMSLVLFLIVAPLVVGAGFLLHNATARGWAAARYKPLALTVSGILAALFAYDLARGMPVLPLLLVTAGLLLPLLASAWRPWLISLVVTSWLLAATGIVWQRWDWRHSDQLAVARAEAQDASGIQIHAYTPGKRRTSAVLPILSHSDSASAGFVSLRVSMDGPDSKIQLAATGLTVSADGAAASESAFLSAADASAPRESPRSTTMSRFHVSEVAPGASTPTERVVHEADLIVPVPAGAQRATIRFTLRIELPDGPVTTQVVVELERRHSAVLRRQSARL